MFRAATNDGAVGSWATTFTKQFDLAALSQLAGEALAAVTSEAA